MAQQGEQGEAVLSQATYKETQYADDTFEIVGESNPQEEFVPLEMKALPRATVVTDPMFADYGGIVGGEETRWHLPQHVAWKPKTGAQRGEAEEAGPPQITMSEDDLSAKLEEARAEARLAALEEFSAAQTEKLAALEGRVGAVLQDIQKQFNENVAQIEAKAVVLATALGEKIVGHAVEINPEYLLEIVRAALLHVGSASIKKIRLSPADLEFVDVLGIRKRMREFDGTWDFEADETIKMGCIVDTTAGEIDFDLEASWNRLRDKIVAMTGRVTHV